MNIPISTNIQKERAISAELLPGAAMWSRTLRRHQVLRLTAPEGAANVAMLLYNRDLLLERYNMADTLKAQHTGFITRGHALYSDMGRVLCSVIEDSCGWHDTVCGIGDAELVRSKYGEKRYQEHRNAYHRNARDLMIVELMKWGLGLRDLVPNLNFFSKVAPSEDGALRFAVGHCQPGACVELRAEMNVLVVLSTCQHPLDPNPRYDAKPVELAVYRGAAPGANDVCRGSCPENERGFANTELLFAGAD
jgi:urea carboxylase-associated protein 2